MSKFTYKGEDKKGNKITKTVEAKDRYEVYDIARVQGDTVNNIVAIGKFSLNTVFNMERINFALSRVKGDELAIVTRNISSMLDAGLPLTRALSVIERQSTNPRLVGVMKSIQAQINKGDPFHVALKKFPKTFSTLYVSMIRAGEESGGLAPALSLLGIQLEKSSNLKKKIKGAMVYPIIVSVVMIVIGILMMIYVVPTMTATFAEMGGDLPTATKVLIGISDFLTQNGLLAFLGAIVIGTAVVSFVRTGAGKRTTGWILPRLPVIGVMVKESNSARMARTLSSLLGSGVDVIGSINITEDVVQNVYYKDVLKEAAVRVEKGEPLSEVFIKNKKLYPVLVGEMIAVGEETGQISKMLTELANFYENEVEQKTKDLSTIIEPVMMVLIGGGVGFFAMAMIAPIYSLSETIE